MRVKSASPALKGRFMPNAASGAFSSASQLSLNFGISSSTSLAVANASAFCQAVASSDATRSVTDFPRRGSKIVIAYAPPPYGRSMT